MNRTDLSGGAQAAMPPATAPDVDPGFERRLIEGIRPIAEHFLATGLHHLFDTGIYDRLAGAPDGMPLNDLADDLDFDPDRLRAFLLYLANEDVVTVHGGTVTLTDKATALSEFRSWYTFLIGGYSSTVDQIGAALRNGAGHCTRDGRNVGLGSCQISRYDGMPVTRSLLAAAGVQPHEVLDLGCGNALYLLDFCRELPGVTAWGAEPDHGSFAEATALIASAELADRVRLVNTTATGFLAAPPAGCDPDLIVFGFVLQEILAQDGEEAVVELLATTVRRFPRINVVVIEVANEVDNPAVMRHGLARNFWNPYYLIHPFTNQRLEGRAFWERIFDKAGLTVHRTATTATAVDSTGVELGYLLRGPRFAPESS